MGAGCTELQQEEEKSLRLSRTRTDGRRPQAENAASKAIMIHALQAQQPPREEREPFHPSVSPARAGSSSDCVLVRWALDTRPAGAGTNPLPISSDAGRTPLRSWPPLSVWNRAVPSSLIGREEGARPAGQARRPPPAARRARSAPRHQNSFLLNRRQWIPDSQACNVAAQNARAHARTSWRGRSEEAAPTAAGWLVAEAPEHAAVLCCPSSLLSAEETGPPGS